MNDARTHRGMRTASIAVILLAGAWIIAAVWAAWSVNLAENRFPHAALNRGAPVSAALLFACACLIARPPSPRQSAGFGESLAVLLFAIVSASLLARCGLTPIDAAVALLVLVGLDLLRRPTRWRTSVVVLAVAAGLSPLAIAPAVLLTTMPAPISRRFTSLLLMAAIALLTTYLLPPWDHTWLAMPHDADVLRRLGPAFLWTVHAEWGDRVAPAVVLAGLAVAEHAFFPPPSGDPAAARRRVLILWLLVAMVASAFMPRVALNHGILFVLPAFLLAPDGCRVFRLLPVDRPHAALSVLTLVAGLLFLVLLLHPLRITVDLLLVSTLAK